MEFVDLGSAGFDFDAKEIGEKIERGCGGGEFDGRVEEGLGAMRAIDGGGFVDFGAEERAGSIVEGEEPGPGFPQVGEAVAEVGSQRDAGSHGFWFTRRHEDAKSLKDKRLLFRAFVSSCESITGARGHPACHRGRRVLKQPIWRHGEPLLQRFHGWRPCG